MAYYKDLSEYSDSKYYVRPGTLNIGWLGGHPKYERGELPEEVKDILWRHCTYSASVARTSGCHECDLCHQRPVHETWKGEKMVLGYAEIRVFGSEGAIYAAPNMIFHYVHTHHYKPPEPFVQALIEEGGPKPKYFEALRKLRLDHHLPVMFIEAFERYTDRPTKLRLAKEIVRTADPSILADIVRIVESSHDPEVNQCLMGALLSIKTPEAESEYHRLQNKLRGKIPLLSVVRLALRQAAERVGKLLRAAFCS